MRENPVSAPVPVIYWPTFLHQENEIEHMCEVLEELLPDTSFFLAGKENKKRFNMDLQKNQGSFNMQ